MEISIVSSSVSTALAVACFPTVASAFTNLDFEDATVVLNDPTFGFLDWELAAPGWEHSSGSSTEVIYFGTPHIGGDQVFLLRDETSPVFGGEPVLSITCRTSDGKQLGYERLDRRGHRELKNLSFHAWRTSTRSTTRDNGVKAYYLAARENLGVIRRARLSTQRKILGTMLSMWKTGRHYSDEKFYNNPEAKRKEKEVTIEY